MPALWMLNGTAIKVKHGLKSGHITVEAGEAGAIVE